MTIRVAVAPVLPFGSRPDRGPIGIAAPDDAHRGNARTARTCEVVFTPHCERGFLSDVQLFQII